MVMVKTELDTEKSNEATAKIMGDGLKEKIFVYIKETDRTQFVLAVNGALREEYQDRADVFLLVFERGFSQEFADGVKKEIAELWKDALESKRIKEPKPETFNPLNPKKARWLRVQLDATDNTIEELRDFIIQ